MCRQEGGGHGAFLLTEGMDARACSGLAHPLRPGPQKARVSAMPVTRCPPGGGVTTICTADNRGTNSTAPEYSAPAAHHPSACCPGVLSRVGACAKCGTTGRVLKIMASKWPTHGRQAFLRKP